MITIIPADQRGNGDFGWLRTRWLFSFSDWYDPRHVGWGGLRVFNDDEIDAKTGFDTHGHRDMEIVTLVHAGAVTHADSMGTHSVLRAGEVQRMSAGSGIRHSEHNRGEEVLHLHQLWFPPRRRGAVPSYAQGPALRPTPERPLAPLVSGRGVPGALTMDADANVWELGLAAGASTSIPGAGHVLVYLMSGALDLGGRPLAAGEQARISDETGLTARAISASRAIVVEA